MAGKNGISVGNQQFTVRNITVTNAVVGEYIVYFISVITLIFPKGINAAWSWGMALVFDSRVMRAHDLDRVDIPACIHQQLHGIYRHFPALPFPDIPLTYRSALI